MSDDAIKKNLEAASFSFIGTVEQLGAATMSNLSINERTAVVNVDHVLNAPPAFAQFEGHRVTVQLDPKSKPPAVGEAAAFFTQGLSFGDSVAVSEVARMSVEDVESHATRAMQAGVRAGAFADLRGQMRNEKLRKHATSESDAVIVGRVVKVEKALAGSASEHDPDWWRATIEVQHVERGSVKKGQVEVLYPNSVDVRWHSAPKPKPSSEGVWMLHATAGALRDAAPYQIVHPDDYQPVGQLDAIRGGKP